MNFKKILVIVIILVHGVFVFSQSEDSKMHFEKAKQYENNKQLIYALGEYYDAYVSDVNQTEARERFGVLLDAISEGNPGVGDFDVFELYDDWILLLQDYEKYWTEYCPFIIKIPVLEKKNLNIENKTATYNYKIDYYEDTEKFSRITKAVKIGLYRVYTTQKWNKDYLYSLTNDRNGSPYWHTTTVYNEIFRYHNYGVRLLASTTRLPYLEEWYEGARTWATSSSLFTTLYDISFEIIDDEGNLIKKIDRQLVNSFMRELTVTAKDMKKIDNGEYRIVPTGIHLFYGNPEENPAITFKGDGERNFLQKLSEIEIDLTKVLFLDSFGLKERENKKIEEERRIKEKENIADEVEYALREIDYIIRHNFYSNKYIEIKKNKTIKNNMDRCIYFLSFTLGGMNTQMPFLSNKYSPEKVERVLYFITCNRLSDKHSLNQYYKIDKNNNNLSSDVEYFLENYDSIIEDFSSNGWHLPNEEEINIVFKSRKNPDYDDDPRWGREETIKKGLFLICNTMD